MENKMEIALTLNEYQDKAMSTCTESSDNFCYMSYGLMGEVGELMGKVAKFIRKEKAMITGNYIGDDGDVGLTSEDYAALKAELGDCLWFVAGLANTMGWSLNDVARENIEKLADRKKRGVIIGNGDNR